VGFIAICSICVAVPVPFLSNKIAVYLLTWFLLFFGAFILPTITGMMLNSVPEKHRASANAVAVLSYNMLGNLPSPFLYGWVSTMGISTDRPELVAA